MDSYALFKQADRLVRGCGTRDPLVIAGEIGVITMDEPGFTHLLGMYTVLQRNRYIFLNPKMNEYWRAMVAAHELGHDQRHRDLARNNALQEFVLFNLKNRTEYEANAFAAHILIDNDDVYDLGRQGYDIVEISAMLNSHINLMLIKIHEMNQIGYNLRIPCCPDGQFLRKIDGSEM